MNQRNPLSFVVLLVIIGCSADDVDLPQTAEIDTLASGRVVVDNTGSPGWSSETAWRLEEDLRLGTVDADHPEEFSRVTAVAADANGMIYVVDTWYHRIQVFHPDGTFSHTIGSEGEGPGEFIAPRAVAVTPEEMLWVVDDGTASYSLFTLDGTFRESHPRRIRGFNAQSAGTFLQNGSYLDWGIGFPDGRQGPRTRLWPIRLGPSFEELDSFPPLEHAIPSDQWLTVPFIGDIAVAAGQSGHLWFAHTEEYRIHRRTLQGDTALTFTLPAEAPPVGKTEREYVRTEFSNDPALYLEALPETKPIVHRILVDNAGHVFVFVDVAGLPPGSVVDVFQETGEYLGRLNLPTPIPLLPRSPVTYATSDHLYVVLKDELDVPYVSRLRIVKGTNPGE